MDTFVLYAEYKDQIEDLDMLQRGRLFTAILEYAAGADPEDIKPNCDAASFMAFKFIKRRMDRDHEAYLQKCQRNRENIKKRWNKKKRSNVSDGIPSDTTVYDRKKVDAAAENWTLPDKTGCGQEEPDTGENDFVTTEMAGNPADKTDFDEKTDTTVYDRIPPYTNVYDSIHNDNDYDNDLKKSVAKATPKESTIEEESPQTELIIAYLNAKTGRHYRPDAEMASELIGDLWRRGYRLPDFERVIDTKVKDWAGGKMSKFLRPSTLFGEHFEEYLQEEPVQEKPLQLVNYSQREVDYDGMIKAGVIGG